MERRFNELEHQPTRVCDRMPSMTTLTNPALALLNVDLEIESEHDLQPLIDELEPVAYSLERPSGRACFELNSAVAPDDPQPLILEFVRLIQTLSPPARSSWDRASKRVFDIGFQSAPQPFQETFRFLLETLRAATEIGAELAVT